MSERTGWRLIPPEPETIGGVAPLPWSVDHSSVGRHWTDSISILDAAGGVVAVLTRGYEGDADGDGCASYRNAQLIVEAVNAAYRRPLKS